MSQCAGTDFRTGPHRLAPTALRFPAPLGREDLAHSLLDQLPVPSTQADTDMAKVTINRAEVRYCGASFKPKGITRQLESDYRLVRWGTP